MMTILTYCSYSEYEVYKRFVGSLYDTGFGGDLYIIAQSGSKEILRRLQTEYPKVKYIIKDNPTRRINSERFLYFQELLKKNKIKSKYILLCDARDLLFQKNPEDYPIEEGHDLYVFEEGQTQIGQCWRNWRWIASTDQIFETNTLTELWEKKILCAGTTIGTIEGIESYLNKMIYCIKKSPINTPQATLRYSDQGFHNYLIYNNKLKNVKFLTNKDNFVNTVGYGYQEVNEQNKIVNRNGEVSYIVHQYDRMSAEQRSKISTKYDFTF